MTAETPTKPISFHDPDLIQRPYEAYSYMLSEAPVYYDESTDQYIVSRYEDIRKLVADSTAVNSNGANERLARAHKPASILARINKLFEEKGWPRAAPMGHYEGEDYRERRDLFERFLRASKVQEYDGTIQEIASGQAERLAAKTEADLVSEYCEQISLRVICRILGAPDEAIPIVKEATDAMITNVGQLGSTEEEEIEVALKEIEAQHFFKRMIDEKRARPDDTILSEFVNSPLPSGYVLTDPEILTLVMLDLFMAGSETASKAMASGFYYLCKNPELQQHLRADLDGNLKTFVEEVLRLEPPARALARIALRDITMHGVTIPKDSLVMLCVSSANRDTQRFGCPAEVDLGRSNAAQHLTFGSGAHSCIGAPLARKE
ncbi:MAG: cytochrome P450, partial [Burkholderiales bacterium]